MMGVTNVRADDERPEAAAVGDYVRSVKE